SRPANQSAIAASDCPGWEPHGHASRTERGRSTQKIRATVSWRCLHERRIRIEGGRKPRHELGNAHGGSGRFDWCAHYAASVFLAQHQCGGDGEIRLSTRVVAVGDLQNSVRAIAKSHGAIRRE